MMYNHLIKESSVQTLMFYLLKSFSKPESVNYTASGAEAVVEYNGKKYKISVEPVRGK